MSILKQLVCVAILGLTFQQVQSRLRRCYVCRSRGELGDCKDPFVFNGTTVDDAKAVEASPCASGWCGKIVEGGNEDFDTATERICVQRPPTDGEERCANTIIERKPVYMCFCLGDLCNAAHRNSIGSISVAALGAILVLLLGRHLACHGTS